MKTTNKHDGRDDCECTNLSRRKFLQRSSLATAAIATAPAWMPRVALAQPRSLANGTTDTLVNIFLRGGMDGLTTCVPYGDGELYNRRPTLAITPPGTTNGALDLDGFFGLPPAAAPLLPAYQNGHLAIVHATGSIDPTRSHFDAQKWVELGVPAANSTGVTTGWISRHLQTIPPMGSGLLRAMALSDLLPRVFTGAPATLPIKTPSTFVMPGSPSTATKRRQTLSNMYQGEAPPLDTAAPSTFATIDLLATIDFAGYVPANGAIYPATTFGQSLKSAAALIKADIGIECIESDFGGWDLHNALGPITGSMAKNLDEFTKSLAAFELDLGSTIRRVTLVAMSEFGRRASENASAGLDHGHGNCMLVMGGHINGAQVMSQWPGLALANLDQGDVANTIDHRDILAEILANRLGSTSLATIFPGYVPTFRGITY